MESFKCFINTDDISSVNNHPNFIPLYQYLTEEKYSDFEYDRREWGRIYIGDNYITIFAASNIK